MGVEVKSPRTTKNFYLVTILVLITCCFIGAYVFDCPNGFKGLQDDSKDSDRITKVDQSDHKTSSDAKTVNKTYNQLEWSNHQVLSDEIPLSTSETATGSFLEYAFPKLNDFRNQTEKAHTLHWRHWNMILDECLTLKMYQGKNITMHVKGKELKKNASAILKKVAAKLSIVIQIRNNSPYYQHTPSQEENAARCRMYLCKLRQNHLITMTSIGCVSSRRRKNKNEGRRRRKDAAYTDGTLRRNIKP